MFNHIDGERDCDDPSQFSNFILEIIDVYVQTSILLALLVKFKLVNCAFGQKSTPRKEKLA